MRSSIRVRDTIGIIGLDPLGPVARGIQRLPGREEAVQMKLTGAKGYWSEGDERVVQVKNILPPGAPARSPCPGAQTHDI